MPDGAVDVGEAARDRPLGLPPVVAALLPLVVLGLVLGLFVATTPLADLQRGEPVPEVTVSHSTLPDDGTMVLHVTNDGPEAVTVAQVLVDEAYWNFEVRGAGGDRTLEPRESARVVVPYHWEPGWDYDVELVLGGARRSNTSSRPPRRPRGSAPTCCGRWRSSACSSASSRWRWGCCGTRTSGRCGTGG